MKRFVISAPRSGLNWVRYCTEHFLGRRTPGRTVLISKEAEPEAVFARSHDALNYTRWTRSHNWPTFLPEDVRGGKLVLILRDPLESFSRSANAKLRHFGNYAGNIHLYGQTAPADRAVFYYEDLIVDPKAMLALLQHLEITPAPGYTMPDHDRMTSEWETVSRASRGIYDVNQSAGGGAMTKDNPTDFTFHQRGLSQQQRQRVWRYLMRKLTSDEYALLARYAPDFQVRPQTYLQRVTDFFG